MRLSPTQLSAVIWLGMAAIVPLSSGCDTEAFCFDECDDGKSSASSNDGGSGGTGGEGGGLFGGQGGDCLFNCGGEGGVGGTPECEVTNGGVEICDGLDNDCDGTADNSPDIDFTSPVSCGNCTTNCLETLTNVDPSTIECTPGPNPGVDPGICSGDCASDFFDLDNNGSCEYFCNQTAPDDAACDNLDNDCDGVTDEDVDFCADISNCGKCGSICTVANGSGTCANSGAMPCNAANTQCAIEDCNPGWHDLDNSYTTGCEYPCTITGPEICDGLDNDCDGLIDAVDDLSGDPAIAQTCFGDPDGWCADPANAGVTTCVAGIVTCTGPNVVQQNDVLETCNNVDDDCDGTVDDSPIDQGNACGQSNILPCQLGTQICQNGALVCVGAVNPGIETCNGVDDDCDGQTDLTNGMPPADSVGACNTPLPPPPGATSPCSAGTLTCTAGSLGCVNFVGPQGPDQCGDDTNCNGILENQPNTNSNPLHCGGCNNNCATGSQQANFSCVSGACVFTGCQPGWYDLDGDESCEYPCIFNQAQEICNGFDDNCDGNIDEAVVAPSPVQQCGVSPSATRPECTTGVTVSCNNGGWQCSFPNGVCSPNCASATEVCDNLDNNCNANLNENVPNFGKACASDAGQPPPGDGACRTFGNYVCAGPNATMCNATTADCSTLPGGCTELCDEIDNDCDGLVDEPFSDPGPNAANYYSPAAVQINANLWVYQYEASRPDASATVPGDGNGYWTGAPAGTTLDMTRSCSEPNKIPWFNVTPAEVEQTCEAMGGFICDTADWTTSCRAGQSCTWAYDNDPPGEPRCTTPYTASKFCNLGVSFDFNGNPADGNQDGLLVTNSSLLSSCFAEWGTDSIFDLTGNLREITYAGPGAYSLMGGAFNSATDQGARCTFDFYTVTNTFKLYDTGFRCCFDTDPT